MIGSYLPSPKYNKNIWHFLAERLRSSGWYVITISSQEKQILRLIDMFLSVMKHRNKYDIAQIDVFSGKAFIYAYTCSILLHRLKKPIVLTLHGGGLPDFCARFPNHIRRLLNRANVVVTPSPYLQKSLGQFRSDIRLIPNPIDLSEAIFRLRIDIKPTMIWVRAFHEIYNPSLLARVLHQLNEEFPDLQCFMLGPDKGDGSLQEMLSTAHTLGVDTKIIIVGPISHSEIPFWLDKADIFINTTNYDTAPRSVLEAMANGLCVVSTNVGGIPYIIHNQENGLLVSPNDHYAMAAAVRKILLDTTLAQRISSGARNTAEKANWSIILPQWEELFQEVFRNKGS